MAEHWKSAPRHWCKQCKVFIRDTAFEKTQHEATGKHQGNLKRFLRDIHRGNERQQRDSQRAKDEVDRLKQAVAGGGDSKNTSAAPWKRTAAAPAPPPAERTVSVEERKKQMAQLAEMGVAIPDEYRGDMSLAGEWQTVSQRVIGGEGGSGTGLSRGVRKRKHEGEEGDEEEEEAKREAEQFVSKAWGSRTREYPGAAAQDDTDLDALLDSTRDIKKVKPSAASDVVPAGGNEKENTAAPAKGGEGATAESEQLSSNKEEPSKDSSKDSSEAVAPTGSEAKEPEAKEPEAAAGGVVFKKRKPKVMRK